MKIEIARYVARCDTCRRVKAIHLKAAGPLQSLPIPTWKWEDISMDFVVGLPRTAKGYDSIWVIVDRLTKIAHFLPVKTDSPVTVYAQLYIARILYPLLYPRHRFCQGHPDKTLVSGSLRFHLI